MRTTGSLTTLEILASIICESGGARFLRLERVKGCPALVVFCTPQTVAALPLDQLSTTNVELAVAVGVEEEQETETELVVLNSNYVSSALFRVGIFQRLN